MTQKVAKKKAKKSTRLRRLTIDRSRWGQGALVRIDDGKMCCLGFVGEACGIPLNYMRGVGLFDKTGGDNAARIKNAGLGWLFEVEPGIDNDEVEPGIDNDWQGALATINDSNENRYIRARKIAKIFADHGVKVTFVGGKSPSTGRKKAIGNKRKK